MRISIFVGWRICRESRPTFSDTGLKNQRRFAGSVFSSIEDEPYKNAVASKRGVDDRDCRAHRLFGPERFFALFQSQRGHFAHGVQNALQHLMQDAARKTETAASRRRCARKDFTHKETGGNLPPVSCNEKSILCRGCIFGKKCGEVFKSQRAQLLQRARKELFLLFVHV